MSIAICFNLDQSKILSSGNGLIFVCSESVGDVIKDGLFKMAEKLGDAGSLHQREVLGSIESASNYTPPTDVSGKYSQSTYITKTSQAVHVTPGNDFLLSRMFVKTFDF